MNDPEPSPCTTCGEPTVIIQGFRSHHDGADHPPDEPRRVRRRIGPQSPEWYAKARDCAETDPK